MEGAFLRLFYISFQINGQRPVRFNGDNLYPYNFDKFQMLFGIDVTEEDNESDVPNCK